MWWHAKHIDTDAENKSRTDKICTARQGIELAEDTVDDSQLCLLNEAENVNKPSSLPENHDKDEQYFSNQLRSINDMDQFYDVFHAVCKNRNHVKRMKVLHALAVWRKDCSIENMSKIEERINACTDKARDVNKDGSVFFEVLKLLFKLEIPNMEVYTKVALTCNFANKLFHDICKRYKGLTDKYDYIERNGDMPESVQRKITLYVPIHLTDQINLPIMDEKSDGVTSSPNGSHNAYKVGYSATNPRYENEESASSY
jgi:hypothetical protein